MVKIVPCRINAISCIIKAKEIQGRETMKQEKHLMHPIAKRIARIGIMLSIPVLLAGFLVTQGSFLAISFCRASVMMFAVSVIGGLFFDVMAKVKGIGKE